MMTFFTIIGVTTCLYLGLFAAFKLIDWAMDVRLKLKKEIADLKKQLDDAKSK